MIRHDLHVHSVRSSCGIHTVLEIVEIAARKGVVTVNICDHGSGLGTKMNFGVVADERRCPREMRNSTGRVVNTLFGVEVNVTARPEDSDYPERYGPKLDLISGGFHRESAGDLYREMSAEHNTAALRDYLQHHPLDILTHPCTKAFPLVTREVVELAGQYGFALEVNNTNLVVGKTDTARLRRMLVLARDAGAPVVECSDGHTFIEIGENAAINQFLAEHGLDGGSMLLNRDDSRFAWFLKERKAKRTHSAQGLSL